MNGMKKDTKFFVSVVSKRKEIDEFDVISRKIRIGRCFFFILIKKTFLSFLSLDHSFSFHHILLDCL